MDERFMKRYESYKKSLLALKEAAGRDPEDSFVLSGTAAKYTITYELSWKVMKDILVQYYGISDFATGSPKEVLRKSFQMWLIQDEAKWQSMHELRNQLAHTYEDTELQEYYRRIVEEYTDVFQKLEDTIEEVIFPS